MKPLIEKLPLSGDTSFVARTHRTPLFEVPWHQHLEYELIFFTEGAGMSFIGNYVGEFEAGDVFFLGSNLPHTFQKNNEDMVVSAVVVHFREDFWGPELLQLPESKLISKLLKTAAHGVKFSGEMKSQLGKMILSLEKEKGFRRILSLLECLALMSETEEYTTVSTQEIKELNPRDRDRIDRIFQYTMDHFRQPIQLAELADIAGMTIPAFCNYFKKRTRKTYIDFVNEIRIGHACKLLLTTEQSILDVCFDSGYNSVANFNRQFMKVKGLTPSAYRKELVNNKLTKMKETLEINQQIRSLTS
ncbi:AraC family transcriptional regulator [Chitinophagaceae bacterium LB-8]|uniref:AraC family transcriptional regulator n=1 Tax=Paraflavisolibacter caeni TaxID=2982496 RepID=A0A9X3B7C3_9BACT|nr:AraC family transcriptional regulator [Paraflavisolibacter caeni]MCU7549035.1 AraC family transcriptional regulator [Paraflavisolibacter caeni]